MSESRDARVAPNADALRHSLATLGIRGRLEARERLAVLDIPDATMLLDPQLRRRALELAREQGFTNLALEIGEEPLARAIVSRD